MSAIGATHLIFSLLAILLGAIVVLLPKGTRWHRTWGHGYCWSMLGVVATALALYDLIGQVTPFHIAAVIAEATLAGMWSVLRRRPRRAWIFVHAAWMAWSYVGLLAAFIAESLTRFVMPALADTLGTRSLVRVLDDRGGGQLHHDRSGGVADPGATARSRGPHEGSDAERPG